MRVISETERCSVDNLSLTRDVSGKPLIVVASSESEEELMAVL